MQKDIPLHDIKPLVEVPDNSLAILIAVVIVSLVLLGALTIWILSLYKETKEQKLRKLYLEKIHHIDISNAKEAAYEMSYYGQRLAKEKREIDMLESLETRLKEYKYKKDVNKLDEDTLAYYKLFLEVLDAS